MDSHHTGHLAALTERKVGTAETWKHLQRSVPSTDDRKISHGFCFACDPLLLA
jgi:hypothetical protein